MRTSSLASVLSPLAIPGETPSPLQPEDLLRPLYELENPSLLIKQQAVHLGGQRFTLPKLLLLGKRGGGVPIRVGLFAGFDAGKLETVAALSQLLLHFAENLGSARDYALFAYPLVNAPGFAGNPQPHGALVKRWEQRQDDADGRYYRAELAQWEHHVLIHLRSRSAEPTLGATTRSALLAREVIAPALQAQQGLVPVGPSPVRVLSSSLEARTLEYAAGRLTPPPGRALQPLEIALHAPASAPAAARAEALVRVTQEILRRYRQFIAYGADL